MADRYDSSAARGSPASSCWVACPVNCWASSRASRLDSRMSPEACPPGGRLPEARATSTPPRTANTATRPTHATMRDHDRGARRSARQLVGAARWPAARRRRERCSRPSARRSRRRPHRRHRAHARDRRARREGSRAPPRARRAHRGRAGVGRGSRRDASTHRQRASAPGTGSDEASNRHVCARERPGAPRCRWAAARPCSPRRTFTVAVGGCRRRTGGLRRGPPPPAPDRRRTVRWRHAARHVAAPAPTQPRLPPRPRPG